MGNVFSGVSHGCVHSVVGSVMCGMSMSYGGANCVVSRTHNALSNVLLLLLVTSLPIRICRTLGGVYSISVCTSALVRDIVRECYRTLCRSVLYRFLLVGGIACESLLFAGIFAACATVALTATCTHTMVRGAGAIVRSYLLGLRGCILSNVLRSVTATTFVLGFVGIRCCTDIFCALHEQDMSHSDVFCNGSVITAIAVLCTTLHASHVAICAQLCRTALPCAIHSAANVSSGLT